MTFKDADLSACCNVPTGDGFIKAPTGDQFSIWTKSATDSLYWLVIQCTEQETILHIPNGYLIFSTGSREQGSIRTESYTALADFTLAVTGNFHCSQQLKILCVFEADRLQFRQQLKCVVDRILQKPEHDSA